jgi:hypothetical protein
VGTLSTLLRRSTTGPVLVGREVEKLRPRHPRSAPTGRIRVATSASRSGPAPPLDGGGADWRAVCLDDCADLAAGGPRAVDRSGGTVGLVEAYSPK